MNDYLPNLKRLLQSHVRPSLPAICRLVDTIPITDGVAGIVLSRTNPDDVRIALRDRYSPNRYGRFSIKLMDERVTVIDRLDQSTRSGRSPPRIWILFVHCKIDNPTSHTRRPNTSPTNPLSPLLRYRPIPLRLRLRLAILFTRLFTFL